MYDYNFVEHLTRQLESGECGKNAEFFTMFLNIASKYPTYGVDRNMELDQYYKIAAPTDFVVDATLFLILLHEEESLLANLYTVMVDPDFTATDKELQKLHIMVTNRNLDNQWSMWHRLETIIVPDGVKVDNGMMYGSTKEMDSEQDTKQIKDSAHFVIHFIKNMNLGTMQAHAIEGLNYIPVTAAN